jgi:hypothetical protein
MTNALSFWHSFRQKQTENKRQTQITYEKKCNDNYLPDRNGGINECTNPQREIGRRKE